MIIPQNTQILSEENKLAIATKEQEGNNLLFTSNSTGANSSFEIIDISSTIPYKHYIFSYGKEYWR